MFELNRLYNLDCMEAMKEIPDKFFEVAITDPPYGIGIDGQRLNINKNPKHSRKAHEKKDWDKAFDISIERTDEFDLPLVNAKNDNNGIMYYGRNCDYESVEMSLDIVCDGASSTGNVFAQPQRTGVLYNAYLIKCNGAKSKYALMFLARVMQNVIKDRYGYENKAGWEKVKNEVILLPVDTTGEPNWAYMERYMMALEQKVVAVLRHFGLWSNIGNICAKC